MGEFNYMEKEISVLIPVFNSESTLGILSDQLVEYFKKLNKSFQIVFVDDGSQDKSWLTLMEIKKQHKEEVKIIRLSKNFGQHNAIMCGMRYCDGKFIITLDDDLQISPEEIGRLLEKEYETDADVVYGIFEDKKHSFLRNAGSKLIKFVSKKFLGYGGEGSSFRLIKKETAQKIIPLNHSFIFIDEVLQWHTQNVSFVNVNHQLRKLGRSKYTYNKLFGMTFNLMIYYTSIPLRIMTFFGIGSSFIFFLFGLFYLYKKFFLHAKIGYTSIIVAIFFSAGLILFCLGIIGEYIRKIYTEQSNKPQFSIKEEL